MSMTKLQWPDYVIMAGFLLISLAIGVYHSLTGGRQRTTQEFIMANRRLGVLPTAMSLFVSFQSAIMILGCTAEMYLFGAQYLIWVPISYSVATLIVERLIVPWIYPLKLVSVNDYLERRFESKAIRMYGAAIGILGGIMYMGNAMYAPSAALESATGLPLSVSIPLMAVVAIAYTALGGMRAVIWTDVFQFGTMMCGLLAILIKGMIVIGGFKKVLEICTNEGRMHMTNWDPDPTVRHTAWGFMIGWVFHWMKVYGLSQASVQRLSATETMTKSRLTLWLNIPALIILYFIACAIGLTVFAYYSTIKCDPLVNKDVSNANQLLSLFVTTIFSSSKGFSGLFLATLYGGALSSVSSSLSGAAANCWDDILRFKLDGMLEYKKAILNRVLVFVFGFLATGIAFMAAAVPGPMTVTQITILFGSVVGGPVYGVFLIGGLTRIANWKGTLTGSIISLCISVWYNIGAYTVYHRQPILPPTSTAGCHVAADNMTSWLITESNRTSLDALWYGKEQDAVTSAPFAYDLFYNVTAATAVHVMNRKSSSSGMQKFYSLSYVWYTMFGAINTSIFSFIFSLIFRDREAESRIDRQLLIPFRYFFSWNIPTPTESNGKETRHLTSTKSSTEGEKNGSQIDQTYRSKDVETRTVDLPGEFVDENEPVKAAAGRSTPLLETGFTL